MKKYVLRNGNDKLFIMRKGETLSDDDFSYTESGNNITLTSYIGSDTDVKIIDKFKDYYVLARPTPYTPKYRLNVTDYEYTNNNGDVVLTKYIGSGGEVDAPQLEEL